VDDWEQADAFAFLMARTITSMPADEEDESMMGSFMVGSKGRAVGMENGQTGEVADVYGTQRRRRMGSTGKAGSGGVG